MVNRNSPKAMYLQIADILRKEVAQGVVPPGGSIGTHESLAERFAVSTITIRKALGELLSEGLLVAHRGKGTFVAERRLRDDGVQLTTMNAMLARNKVEAEVNVLSMRMIPTPTQFESEVKAAFGAECLHVERSHSSGGKVIGYAHIYLPKQYADHFTWSDVSASAIYQIYEKKIGLSLGVGVQTIRAASADSAIASALKIREGDPVLVVERKAYSAEGTLVEVMTVYYRSDLYSFQVQMQLSAE